MTEAMINLQALLVKSYPLNALDEHKSLSHWTPRRAGLAGCLCPAQPLGQVKLSNRTNLSVVGIGSCRPGTDILLLLGQQKPTPAVALSSRRIANQPSSAILAGVLSVRSP
jgi:hypothetical protein